jgi:esterase/lipase
MRSHKAIRSILSIISKINPMLGANIGLSAFSMPISRRKSANTFPNGTRTETRTILNKKTTIYKYGKSIRKVLLVHGWEGAASDFSHFFEALSQNGFEVVAIDLPGHGQSPKSRLNAIMAAEIIRELEINHGPYSAIIGHSFGAFSTGYALSKFKELESIPFVSVGSPNKLKSILNNFSRLVGFSNLQNEYIFSKIEKDMNIRINEFEQGKFLEAHNGPVLVIHDKDDQQVPFHVVKEIKAQTLYPKFLLTEGLGHNRILRDKETIKSIIGFLNQWKDTRGNFEAAYKFGLL